MMISCTFRPSYVMQQVTVKNACFSSFHSKDSTFDSCDADAAADDDHDDDDQHQHHHYH